MLYIYRASAGSGKTFLLTGFYIELLFRRELTPVLEGRDLLFNEILAVTFTNKATAEMKERIVKELNTLWRAPRESQYYARLTAPDSQGRVMADEELQRRAHGILRGMLTDYSNVHISTIDSFFQRVVRSFARELNVQGNYEVELDADMVLDHAVSQFLLTLDPTSDKETFDWLVRFSNNRMADGSHWNVHRELVKLANVLISEEYRKHSEKVGRFAADKAEMSRYVETLDEIIRNWRRDLKGIGQECCNLLMECDLQPADFSGGQKSLAKKFALWAKGEGTDVTETMRKWADDPETWFSKKNAHLLARMGASADKLQELLQAAIELLDGQRFTNYNSARCIRSNIYQLGLLGRLERAANDYCAGQGIKLLSNTTQMLNALVTEQASPFVYEKTGTRIISYMIDEFQDTSGMQWENFSPLLRDSLANGSRDLIVGDVKQSIYRWRGSDWELLHSRLNSFEADKQAVDADGNQLRDNWRSDLKIIRFNNQFFQFASRHFAAMEDGDEALAKIAQIYADVEQTVSPARKNVADGQVAYEVLPGREKSAEYKAEVTRRLPELVIALQQQGYQAGDILILCRKREQCSLCAKALMDYRAAHPQSPYPMEIITAEALQLTNQRVIHALVAALEFLHDPRSDYRRAVASACWLSLSMGSVADALAAYFAGHRLPDFESLLNLPLYETVERLIAMLPAQARREGNFIQAFCDVVLDFCAKEGPSLDSFLSWWRDNGQKCNVTTPTQQNAIRIMTIHQSKGLAGDAVIVPFAQETLDIDTSGKKAGLLWCEPQTEPFRHDNLVVPIEVSKMMKNSIFRPDYDAERIRAIIDNLNTAYVAFTRAKHALIILTPTPPKEANASLQCFLATFFAGHWAESVDHFVADGIDLPDGSMSAADAPLAETQDHQDDTGAADAPAEIRLPLIKQTAYVPPSDSAAARGTTLHAALSAITDYDHIDEPVTRLFQSGRARLQGGMTLADVLQHIHDALRQPEARTWFDPRNRALNEQDIITRSTHTQRPDRVIFTPDGRAIVIDYKTGEERNRLYQRQVGHYMALLGQMGFQRVEGYLWYIETGHVVPVRP